MQVVLPMKKDNVRRFTWFVTSDIFFPVRASDPPPFSRFSVPFFDIWVSFDHVRRKKEWGRGEKKKQPGTSFIGGQYQKTRTARVGVNPHIPPGGPRKSVSEIPAQSDPAQRTEVIEIIEVVVVELLLLKHLLLLLLLLLLLEHSVLILLHLKRSLIALLVQNNVSE
jgi:hypothetical protein